MLNKEKKVQPTSVSGNSTKPNVGCCTSMNELIQWCILNAFNIEGQDCTTYVAIDYEEMKDQFDYLLEKERKQMIDFHIGVMKQGLITENDAKWEDGYFPKIEKEAEQYFNNTFKTL